jgi:hypothetical protein
MLHTALSVDWQFANKCCFPLLRAYTHVAGSDNNLVDIALQAITQLDGNHAFLTHLNNLFPYRRDFGSVPAHHPRSSPSDSTLRGQRWTMQQWILPLEPPAGTGVNNTAPIVERHQS